MKSSHFADAAPAPARALPRARLHPMRTKFRTAAATAFVVWAIGCEVESDSGTRNSGNASGGQDGTGGLVECNPDVEAFCATAVCSRTPGPGDCGQESFKPTGNLGHKTGCGFYRLSITDDAGQEEVYIHDEETGDLVYYRERHWVRELVTTEVGCEPVCADWEVIPCPPGGMGGIGGEAAK